MSKVKSERDIISDVWEQLYDEGYCDAAEVMNYCCSWANKGALRKVRYWLKRGIANNGDYSEINNYIFKNLYNPEEIVPVDDLIYAFKILELEVKNNDFRLNTENGEYY